MTSSGDAPAGDPAAVDPRPGETPPGRSPKAPAGTGGAAPEMVDFDLLVAPDDRQAPQVVDFDAIAGAPADTSPAAPAAPTAREAAELPRAELPTAELPPTELPPAVLPATADEVSVLSDGATPVEVPVVDIASVGRRGGGGRAASRVGGERTTRPRRSAAPEAEAEASTDADDGDETSSAPGRKPARRSSFGGSSFGDGGSRSFGNRSRGGRAGARRPRKEWGIQLDAEVDEPVADTGAAGQAVTESTPRGAEQQHERSRQPARGRAGSFGRPRRAEGEPPPVYEDPEQAARQICLTALTGAARTRRQLADLLAARDIPEDAAEAVLERFAEVGLVDDAAFAAAWVSSRQSARGLSRRALGAELRAKGVDAEVASVALEAVDPQDEWDTARVLVARKVPGMRRLDTATATRRLTAMLSRKGYGGGLAAWVVREALEADGKAEDAAAEADTGPSAISSTDSSDDGPGGPDDPPVRRGLWSGRPLDEEPGPSAEVGEGLGLDGWARSRSARRGSR